MRRYLAAIFLILFLGSCEDTNVGVMADAANDAVTVFTLSDEEVQSLARRAAVASDDQNNVAPEGSTYERRLRRLVAGYSERDGSSFNYKVYLTKNVNAFAMADGTIRVNSGLMDLMTDEELLFVIGHEMGHVVKEHSRRKVVLAYASSALRKALASQENEVGQIARSVVGAFAEQLTNAQFSQHEERQADQYGVFFLQSEGYSMEGAVSALEKLAELARQHTFLSSHPDPEARITVLLEGADNDSEEQDSIFGKLLKYSKMILLQILQFIHAVVTWILSLL